MVTQQSAIELINNFILEIKNSGLHLRKAILFGSYAKKTQNENSDIDVALVADEFTGFGFEDIGLFSKTLVKYFVIQPRTYNTKYFEKSDPFIEEIKRTGIEIKVK
ncbi:MAG: nucleotidyltransferase domain-containing protein [Bacteroidia bacterium]|nr:nucleotidyltransferase domain-containing protein [Bacteroidia bacterium]